MNGFLNILKPTGLTSSDVVSKVKRILNTKKVGHMGTLDPAGSGVLPVAIGKSARLFPYLTYKIKKYRAYFTFSKTTDTLDSFGSVIEENNIIPTKEAILSRLNAFQGEIKQVPPKYSAINIGGKKAYNMARNGEEFEIKERLTMVYSFELIDQISSDTFVFDITCSGGTYVRSLCRDLAHALGTVAYMSLIIRLKSGSFLIENSITLDELEEQKDKINELLISPFDILSDMEVVEIKEKCFDKLANGIAQEVNNKDGLYRVVCRGEFFGIGEVKEKTLKIVTYLRDTWC